jgi:hypothetical protein
LGCCMLHHLVSSNKLAEFCALSIVRARLSEVVVFFVCLDSKQNALELHSSQLQWVVAYWVLCLHVYNQSEQLMPLVVGHFRWRFSTIGLTKCLHCNNIFWVVIPEHTPGP